MGRFESHKRPASYNEAPEYHPIWRGVGFGMMILIPIISYAASVILFNLNLKQHWIALPKELVVNVLGDSYLIMKILLAVIIAFVIYVLFMAITYVANRFFGPPRYGPMDAPPIRIKTRRSR